MFNQQYLFETLLGGNSRTTSFNQTNTQPPILSSSNFTNDNTTTTTTTSIHNPFQPSTIVTGGSNNNVTAPINTHHPINNNSTTCNESLLQQQLLYNQLVLMNQALSQNILIMSNPTPLTTTNTTTMYHNTINTSNNYMFNSLTQPPSLLSLLSSLTATIPSTQQEIAANSNTIIPSTPTPTTFNNPPYHNNSANICNPTTTTTTSPTITTMNTSSSSSSSFNYFPQHENFHQEIENTAKPWLFMLENMLKQRPNGTSMNQQIMSTTTNNGPMSSNYLSVGNSSNCDTFNQQQYSGFSRESNLSPSIFQELDDIIGSIDPIDIVDKQQEMMMDQSIILSPLSSSILDRPTTTNNNTSCTTVVVNSINNKNNNITTCTTTDETTLEKKKKSKRNGQGRGGNNGGKYLAESASKEVSPTFDYFVHNSENIEMIVVQADFDGIVLTPHERCLCALLSKAILPRDDLKSLIIGPSSVTLRSIISKWLFGKLDASSNINSAEESTGSDQISSSPLSVLCDPMGFTINKSAKPTRLSVFVNDTLKLRIRPSTFEKSSIFDNDTVISDISTFNQNMMNLFINHYSVEMHSAHYLTGLAGGLSKESDLSTTNIMNTPDICMKLLSEHSIVQFTEDISKSNSKSCISDSFDVCISVRRDHHYKVKLPPIKEVSLSLGFGNTSPNSALNKKISFIQIVESDSQRPICRSEPFWCRSKSRAEMEKKQNREALQRKTVRKEGEKKRKPKSPHEQEKKRRECKE